MKYTLKKKGIICMKFRQLPDLLALFYTVIQNKFIS